MRMLYKDMFHVNEEGIPDTRVRSEEFDQQGTSFDELPPCHTAPKLGQQHSLMSNPDDWPEVLFTPTVVDVVQGLMGKDSVANGKEKEEVKEEKGEEVVKKNT
jgi:hypothetical protein